jgi:hypothetical protein
LHNKEVKPVQEAVYCVNPIGVANRGLGGSKLDYERRQPEKIRLYQVIAEHWETFKAEREMEGRT